MKSRSEIQDWEKIAHFSVHLIETQGIKTKRLWDIRICVIYNSSIKWDVFVAVLTVLEKIILVLEGWQEGGGVI